MKKLILGLILLALMAIPISNAKAEVTVPYAGKMIALDAGHDGSDTGAVNIASGLQEKVVNLEVVYALKLKLEDAGATVVLSRVGDETIVSRKERIDIAKVKCATYGRSCDILISVHHNGSTDQTVDGTLTIYNGKLDKPLAYIITNDWEASQFLYGTRKDQEVQALYDGIGSYFSSRPIKRK